MMATTPPALEAATWTPRPGARVPLELTFRDEAGRPLRLADVATRPMVLALGYHACHNLCGATLDGLAAGLAGIQRPACEVLAISIDPKETPADAASRKQRYRGRPGSSSWRFLVGDAPTIQALTGAVGFNYAPAASQFAHPAGLVILAPDGRVKSYLGGVSFPPAELAQAMQEPTLREVLLRCFHYDPASAGAHDGQVLAALRLAGSAMALAVAGLVVGLLRRERKAGRP